MAFLTIYFSSVILVLDISSFIKEIVLYYRILAKKGLLCIDIQITETLQWRQSIEYIFWNFRLFILHNNVSIWGTLLLQNFVRKPIKIIL